MRRTPHCYSLLGGLLLVASLLTVLAIPLAGRAPVAAQSRDTLPPPHLGYGIHIGPHTAVNHDVIDRMGMDWVKVYEIGQVAAYRDKRVLFRMDLPWPANWEAFRTSVRQRAAELSALGVDAIEVHNEPNLAYEWPRGPNAWEYTQMLRVAYTQIKAVNPHIIVVSGGLAPAPTTPDRRAIDDLSYTAEMLDNGAAQWFDAFGYHPYGFNQPPEAEPSEDLLNFRRAELVWALFEERGIYDKQIWMTEFGWLRDPAEEGVQCSDSHPDFAGFAWMRVSAEDQAAFTARAFDWADRRWPWAGPMFLWNLNWALYDYGISPPCSHMRWFSVLRSDGSPLPVVERMAALNHRYSTYLPHLTIFAENMTVEVGVSCPASVLVGEFQVFNTGYPGQFAGTVTGASPPGGPLLEIYPETVTNGDTVQVFADTRELPPGLYIIYINVAATIGQQTVAESIQGYVVVSETRAGC